VTPVADVLIPVVQTQVVQTQVAPIPAVGVKTQDADAKELEVALPAVAEMAAADELACWLVFASGCVLHAAATST
jgi:hypothetical protein